MRAIVALRSCTSVVFAVAAVGPPSTSVRSRLKWSGAATTKPQEASRAVRKVDWSRKPA